MAQFVYTARDPKGNKLKGKVEAKNRDGAASILREKGLFIVSLRDHSESALTELQSQLSRVSIDDVVNFTRQLATMINAGLPLIQSLSILQEQSRPAMQKILKIISRDIEAGMNFGDALAKHPNVFSRIFVSLVKAGEAAGALDTILLRLADNMEKQKEFRSKTKGALVYPTIILSAMAVVVVVMMIFVVPKMTALYADFDAELPVATQMLMNMSNFFRNRWYVLIAVSAGAFVLFRSWKKTPRGERQLDTLLLKLPVFGPLRHKMLITEFARTMSLMVGAGISLLQALEIVETGLDNVIYRTAIVQARILVEKGQSLSQSLDKQSVFPILLPQMVAVGEQTGQLDEVLKKLATYYESETEQAIKAMTTALEPMIMVVLGVGVGFLIIAIVMPIYNLTSQF